MLLGSTKFTANIYHWRAGMRVYQSVGSAFELCKSHGLTENLAEFSQVFLGQNQSYFITLKSNVAEPTLGAVAILATRLQSTAEAMMATKKYRHLALKLMNESEKLRDIVNEDGVELDLDGAE